MTTDQKIKEYFNTEWTFTDFFYAYCSAKGIDNPEEDVDEETYNRLEDECEKKLTFGLLNGLREVIIEDINERIYNAMKED